MLSESAAQIQGPWVRLRPSTGLQPSWAPSGFRAAALGRRICEEFDDPRGRWQLAGCLKALNILATRSDASFCRCPKAAFPGAISAGGALQHVPERLELVRELSIQRVRMGSGAAHLEF